MPDTFSHFLHGYFIYGLKGGIFAMLPDLLSFSRLFIKLIPKRLQNIKNKNYKKIFEKPDLKDIDKTDYLLYNLFHSLVIWVIIYLIKGDKEYYVIFLAIIIDSILHEKTYLPTPLFYPISKFKFDGISWSSKLGWISSISITLFIFFRFYKKN